RGVLHGEVPEAADPEDRDPLARPGRGVAEAREDREARAEDRRRLLPREAVRDERAAVGPREHELREAAAHLLPRLLVGAVERAPRLARAAAAAALLRPRDADAVAHAERRHAGTE